MNMRLAPKAGEWCRAYCAAYGCLHHAPMTIAPLIIRWGQDSSSDMLRRSGRCKLSRSQTIISKRARSAAFTSTFLSRMPRSPQEANAGVPPR
jgi:hypothetical protein